MREDRHLSDDSVEKLREDSFFGAKEKIKRGKMWRLKKGDISADNESRDAMRL